MEGTILSEETVMKFKLATLVTIAMGIISIAVTVIGFWVGNVSGMVGEHDRNIATLKECTKNQAAILTRIESTVEDIRNDQIRRFKQENK